MKAIAVKKETVIRPEYVAEKLVVPCSVRSGVMVGSITCQNCKSFDAYDEGKGTVVLCDHPDQKEGAFVYER